MTGGTIMKKLIVLLLVLVLGSGVALAAGGKNRGDNGSGTIIQDLCGPNDDCSGDPYWW